MLGLIISIFIRYIYLMLEFGKKTSPECISEMWLHNDLYMAKGYIVNANTLHSLGS